jgi:hypothetical protein
MKVIDPGHVFELSVLDGSGAAERLIFIKREGENYPGNTGHHSGTTLQEVWRASIARLKYLNNQIYDSANIEAISYIEAAIWVLERRAAKRHGRKAPGFDDACYGIQCPKCLHVGCKGECHA